MPGGTRKADAHIPAQLVAKRVGERLARINDRNWKSAELDAMAARGNAIAQLVIVGKMVHQRFEAADFSEALLSSGHGGAQREIHRSEQPRNQNSRGKVRAVANRLEICSERAVRHAAIEASDRADRRIAKGSGDGAQVFRLDAHVAIADRQNFVPRLAYHAAKLVHFVADAPRLRADQQINAAIRKIAGQLCNHRDGGILLVAHAKQYFVIRIILRAKAGVILVGLTVQAIDRFEDTDRRREIARKRSGIAAAKKTKRREDRH